MMLVGVIALFPKPTLALGFFVEDFPQIEEVPF